MEHLNGMTQVLFLASAIAIIVGILLQIIKKASPSFDGSGKNERFLPILAVLVGLIVGAISYPFTDLDLTLRLWAGFIAGAASSGFYNIGEVVKRP